MIEANIIQLVTNYFPNFHDWNDALQQLHLHTQASWTVLAQQVQDPDVLGQMQKSFNNFIKSGQVWALGIGIVIGYMIKGFTSF
ncbi:MAG TPA: hypothetical protein V6D31_01055 [Candidatus Sericytochromatia bacterium]